MESKKTNYPALYSVILIFFFWGFIPAGNSIFIPFCKDHFHLDLFQSQLIDFAFYMAYYLGAILLFGISMLIGREPIGALGYKKSTVLGLLISVIGACCMIFNLYQSNYIGILIGLFIVGLGFSLQQTSVYPFVISLGDERTGPNRTSLGGAVNSIGTTLGPLFVALALFGSTAAFDSEQISKLNLKTVALLYGIVAVVFVILAAFYFYSKNIPDGRLSESTSSASYAFILILVMTGILFAFFIPVLLSYGKEIPTVPRQGESMLQFQAYLKEQADALEWYRFRHLLASALVIVVSLCSVFFLSRMRPMKWGAMRYPQLILGMLAIFFYVGVEVSVGNNLAEYMKKLPDAVLSKESITPIISLYWGSLMIGRLASSIYVFNLSKGVQSLLLFVMPFAAFALVLGANYLMGYEVGFLWSYSICVLLMILGFYLSRNKPVFTLALFTFLGMVACAIGIFSSGMLSVYAFLFTGLCSSIMWPCIFSLSLAGLGSYTAQGSSFLIMMILGGALIPPLQGKLADIYGPHQAYWVCFVCFSFLLAFTFIVSKVLKRQGIHL